MHMPVRWCYMQGALILCTNTQEGFDEQLKPEPETAVVM
jgi:hypothetical protein